ncbi:MAG: retroviral-like aspartic protease family protein [Muribaculum sp.]|nr:retroviral-like aspartic protease family protein [Muribaculum sp.]
MANLRKAFELGFRRFHHVMADDDLEELRATPGFEELMNEFKTPTNETKIMRDSGGSSDDMVGLVSETVKIPFIPDGGCLSVKCSINELPLSFIFDTGASVVSLSQVEANFMLKNGYLKSDDFVGSGRIIDANGNVSEGSIVNIRRVDFGGMTLNNIRASVVRNQKAPLLLGQSVLGRLGRIEIDNANKKLIINK